MITLKYVKQHYKERNSDNGIDILMKPIIDKLNDKGFITEYSCQSHGNSLNHPYIQFKYIYNLCNPPEGWNIEQSMYINKKDDYWLKYTIQINDQTLISTSQEYIGFETNKVSQIPHPCTVIRCRLPKWSLDNNRTEKEMENIYCKELQEQLNKLEKWVDKL